MQMNMMEQATSNLKKMSVLVAKASLALCLSGCISSVRSGDASDAEDEAEDIVKTISSWLEPYKGALGVTVQRDGSSTYLYTTFGTFSSVFNRFHLAFVVDCEEREVQCYGYLPTIVPEGRRSEMAEFIFRGEWEYGISTASIVLEGDGSVRCQAWSPFESFALQPKETEWRLMGAVVDKLWSFSEGVARVALGGDPVVAAGEVKRIAFFEGKVGAAGLENSAEDDTKIVLERCFDEDHEIEVSDSTDEWLEALSGHGGDEHVGIIKARIEDIARYLGGRYDVLPYSLVVKDGMVWNVCNVPEDCPSEIIRDVADALMKINQGLKYAMFGIDFNTGRIWSHYAVPVPVIPDRDEKPRRNLYAAFILMKTVQSIAQNSEVLHSAMIRAWSSFDCDEERSNDNDGGIDNEQE